MRVCHMQQEPSRGIMAEVQVYATVEQARQHLNDEVIQIREFTV